jgi:4'-phosphopantetheinyl transferase
MDRAPHVLADWSASGDVALEPGTAHVWRVRLDDDERVDACWPVLSSEEQAKARRFFRDVHRRRYVLAHGMLRAILARYVAEPPESLRFADGEHGKPSLVREPGASSARVEFNLSHSDDIALVAVALDGPVGVDLERWSEETEHLELAERFFSPAEREALRALAGERAALTAGFFAAWTRKEAYLKATGTGITRGLHHFDVSLSPGERARLVADRHDPGAAERWAMHALGPAEGFSAALVATAPLRDVRLFDAAGIAPRAALQGLPAVGGCV